MTTRANWNSSAYVTISISPFPGEKAPPVMGDQPPASCAAYPSDRPGWAVFSFYAFLLHFVKFCPKAFGKPLGRQQSFSNRTRIFQILLRNLSLLLFKSQNMLLDRLVDLAVPAPAIRFCNIVQLFYALPIDPKGKRQIICPFLFQLQHLPLDILLADVVL